MEEDIQLASTNDGEGNDLNKFTNLCSELECALANSYTALDEVLSLKDIILEQNLPSAVKVKLALSVGRLHRSMSDMSVPTGEMTRLVRLYAVPWENKSKALKKLHKDYESKQHKLDVALRRLELLGVQTLRMEKERRIMNWEKLFAKLVGGKGHGQRWRFLIYQFKQKLKKGEDISTFYSTLDDEDKSHNDNSNKSYNGENSIESKKNILLAQEFREKFKNSDVQSFATSDSKAGWDGTEDVKAGRNSIIEDESEASIVFGASDDNTSMVGAENETPVSSQLMKKKVRFDKGAHRQQQEERETDVKVHEVPKIAKEMSDKVCWTQEPDFEDFFNIRVFSPNCKTLTSSWCTVVFDNEIRRSQVFYPKRVGQIDAEEKQAHKNDNARDPHDETGNDNTKRCGDEFQEFSFKLEKDFFGRNKDDVILKFSVHPANSKKMIAMTTVKLSDVVIDDEKAVGDSLENSEVKPTSYQIKSTVNNSELIFNRNCGEISILCFYSRVFLPLTISRGTETISIEELTSNIIESRRKEFLMRMKSASTSMTEKPIYTEEQMHSTKENLRMQLRALREEYEDKLSLMISQLKKENVEDLREFVHAATSPLCMWTDSSGEDMHDESSREWILMEPVQSSTEKLPKKFPKQKSEKKQKVWGQNLPENFYERMEMFKEESSKYHENLRVKIKDEVGKEFEKKLASSNRLDRASKDPKLPDEVCLPALFMPTKTRNLYTPKARSYFHAFGTYKGRLTQAPSILELPKIKQDNSDIVGIYETVMKQKFESLTDHENDTDLGRFSPESSTSLEIARLENDEDMDGT